MRFFAYLDLVVQGNPSIRGVTMTAQQNEGVSFVVKKETLKTRVE